jgi:hypothetical protein
MHDMTPAQEADQRLHEILVYRPGFGAWLAYSLLLAIALFLAFVSFYETQTDRDHWICLAAVVGPALLLLDLGVARIEIGHHSVRIHGLLQTKSAELTYREMETPPERVAPAPLARPVLQQRLANGRVVKFPVWLGAGRQRQILRRIEAEHQGIAALAEPTDA